MHSSFRVFAALGLAALASVPAQAAENYLLAVSWEPAFCETKPSKPECQSETGTRFDASHFSLHGLWPQSGSYCGVSRANKSADAANRWNRLPAVHLQTATRADLNTKMPGTASYLERHEWIKHGTCSGYGQQAYFAGALSLLDGVNAGSLATLVAGASGASVTLDQLYEAVTQDYGGDAEPAVEFICSAINSRQVLSEIRFHLNLPATLPDRILPQHLVAPDSPASPSQLCDAGAVYIDSVAAH